MEGIAHAIAVACDLVELGHVNSVTLFCACGEGGHVYTVFKDNVTKQVMIKGPGDEADA